MQIEANIARQFVFFENTHVGSVITGTHFTSHFLVGKVKQDDDIDSTPGRVGTKNSFDVHF